MFTKLALSALLCGVAANAQTTYLQEDFDGDTVEGWTLFDNGVGTANSWIRTSNVSYSAPYSMAVVYENVTGLAQDWLVTPQIDLSSATAPRLNFYARQSYTTDYGSVYKVLVSTTSQTDVATFTEVQSWTETELGGTDEFVSKVVDLSAYAGQNIYVAFMMENDDGDNFIVDNVWVVDLVEKDARMESVNLPNATAEAQLEIKGTFSNVGQTEINTIDVNWQVDEGAVNTETISGLNVSGFESYDFQATDTWATQTGEHTVKVWVNNINGAGDDEDTSNDMMTRVVSIASNTTPRVVLFEQFTSATCAPCATANQTLNHNFFDQHADELTVVKYQMNWPGTGDVYYTEEGGVRRSLYGVNAIPALMIDGKEFGGSISEAALNASIAEELAQPTFVVANAAHQIDGNNINVDMVFTPYVSGNFNVQVAVLEHTTTGNVGSNGETQFENVMMKMLPNASGTNVDFVDGAEYSLSLSADLSGTHVEEMSDLRVVVFVQDTSDKSILQSTYSVEGNLGVSNVDNVVDNVIFTPNPSNGMVKMLSSDSVNIEVFSLTGKMVHSQKNVSGGATLNLSGLPKGVYVINAIGENYTKSQKLIIK